MKKSDNLEQILLEYLKSKNSITLSETIKLLGVSESTVRRLFIKLENNSVVVRKHGYIYLVENQVNYDYYFDKVQEQAVAQKILIGRKAAKLIEENDMIFLDSGTTMAHFCVDLVRRIEKEEVKNITVFTNSLVNLDILEAHCKVNLIGGEYRANRRDFCGYLSEQTIDSLHFSKCVLGTDGFHEKHGFTATDFYTARLDEKALLNSEKKYILMDSRKFYTASVVGYSKNISINGVVTDKLPEEEIVNKLLKVCDEIIS